MNEWIPVKTAAALAGRSVQTIYGWIAAGHLITRVGAAGRRLVEGRQVLEVEATMRPGRPRKDTRA